MALCSSNQTKSCSNLGGKVRVIARIRGFTDQELASDATHTKCMISVSKAGEGGPFEKVKLSFDDQTSSRKNEYDVDHCYLQNEDTALIFSREIKPHISRVFDGENSTFIAFGARDSGKTYTIQGSDENHGLGMLVMDEILKIVGGKHRVTVSIYEVTQDHVYDLLDPKNPEVQVLEDAHGKIMLKGLSKVPVKSLLEFQKLYFSDSSSNKPTKKITLRSHKALMINILACDEGGKSNLVGKMNFVDLAGYENARRNSIDGSNLDECRRINKSLNALLNVIHALNANETRVPFRETKIARVLQNSLGGNNHISMLFCLNPLFCPDTIHVATLASRLKNIKPLAACSAAKKQTNFSASISAKKHTKPPLSANKVDSKIKQQTNSRLPLSAKKTNPVLKGRNLFGGIEEVNGLNEQTLSMEDNVSNIGKSDITDGDSTFVVPDVKEEASEKTQNSSTEILPPVNGDNIEKENKNLAVNESQSPPLSVKLKEMSNYLKSLNSSSTPLPKSKPHDANTEAYNFGETMEPKTPSVAHKFEISNSQSGSFSKRTSGLKQALVQNYLHFLNTASEDELKGISGIKAKRASYILELRENSPEPFKSLDDLQELGLSAKQVTNMMKDVARDLFS